MKLAGGFAVGKRTQGKITHPGYEHVMIDVTEVADGTLLTVVESGFDQIPAGRRAEAFRMNTQGWAGQMENIRRHVAG